RRDDWRARRDARREEWRARREERRNKWAHLGDPAFWGLDEESLRSMGCMPPGAGQSSEVKELKERVATMEETIARLSERIVVLEKLAVAGDDARLAAEIEKLRT
ncbi:MAG TPA: hypothetical protein VFV70_04620, partial [Hyphomonadaceae bacterium]|nr:hypothetical protein [Hyphomonadaceae bacterium]